MANENIRKSFAGASAPTTLAVAISAATTSITLVAGSSFPNGTEGPGPFVISIGRNTITEEKILCTSRTGNVITVLQRGYDGTVATDHDDGDSVLHVLDANTVIQANKLANIGTANGDLPYFSAAGVPAKRAIGTDGYPLLSSGGVPNYGKVGVGGMELPAWQSYTPAWSGTIGNGTLSGAYRNFNGVVDWEALILWGSTTSHAAGQQTISIPLQSPSRGLTPVGQASYATTGPSFVGEGQVLFATGTVTCVFTYNANQLLTNTSFAFANGSQVVMHGSYRI